MVPGSVGKLKAGELLVSNFNAKSNKQGTGTTIEQVSARGKTRCSRRSAPRVFRAAARAGSA